MTILFKTGNILDVREGIIVHGCNLKGVMGSGLALQIKISILIAIVCTEVRYILKH